MRVSSSRGRVAGLLLAAGSAPAGLAEEPFASPAPGEGTTLVKGTGRAAG